MLHKLFEHGIWSRTFAIRSFLGQASLSKSLGCSYDVKSGYKTVLRNQGNQGINTIIIIIGMSQQISEYKSYQIAVICLENRISV